MEKQHVDHIEGQIKVLCARLSEVADDRDMVALIAHIRQPGWTTPAEALLVAGLVDGMLAHAQALASLKQTLVTGSRAVTMAK